MEPIKYTLHCQIVSRFTGDVLFFDTCLEFSKWQREKETLSEYVAKLNDGNASEIYAYSYGHHLKN